MSTNAKEAILEAARRTAQTHGYSGLNFRELGDEVGIKAASIYYHFPSKQRIERELHQVEDELHHIERAFLAGLVGETTAGLLKDREARRTVFRQQLQGLQHPRESTSEPVTLSTIRRRLEDLYGLIRGTQSE